MEVILSGRAWLPVSEIEPLRLTALKKRLTKKPHIPPDYRFDEEPDPVQVYEESNGFIGVPRGFFLKHANIEHKILDERVRGTEIPEPRRVFEGSTSGNERFEEQTRALEEVKKLYGSGSVGGIVQAVPAWGKTAFAIRLVCNIGRRTLVGVHKEFLAKQWKARFEKMAPYLKVGIWQGKTAELEDTDVVVAMIQTLTKRDVPEEVAASFGLCIWDEVHRVGARTWSTVPPMFKPRFHLGLSARPKRADRMDEVIRWLVGPVVFKAKYQTPVPAIYRVHTAYKRPQWIQKVEDDPDNPEQLRYPTHLKALTLSRSRNERIVQELENILRHPVGRKVVVMSERVKHLHDIADILRDRDMAEPIPDFSMGFVHSKVRVKAKAEAERKRVIFTTFQMLEEGFDISALDTLVMTTARADVEQPVGRIRRECRVAGEGATVTMQECKHYCPWKAGKCESKPKPIAVEFTDPDVPKIVRKIKYRSKYYKEIGAEVREAR